MVGMRFCGLGCGWAPVRGFLFLFRREIHTKGLRTIFSTRPGEDEEKQVPRAVNKRKELALVRKKRQSERGSYWRRSWDLWTKKPGHPARVSVPGSCVQISCRDTLVIATERQKSIKKFSLLTLRANPSPFLFVLLSSTLGYICYICCIFVKYMKCPWPEMRGTTRLSNGHEVIQEDVIVGADRVVHIVTDYSKFKYDFYRRI